MVPLVEIQLYPGPVESVVCVDYKGFQGVIAQLLDPQVQQAWMEETV